MNLTGLRIDASTAIVGAERQWLGYNGSLRPFSPASSSLRAGPEFFPSISVVDAPQPSVWKRTLFELHPDALIVVCRRPVVALLRLGEDAIAREN